MQNLLESSYSCHLGCSSPAPVEPPNLSSQAFPSRETLGPASCKANLWQSCSFNELRKYFFLPEMDLRKQLCPLYYTPAAPSCPARLLLLLLRLPRRQPLLHCPQLLLPSCSRCRFLCLLLPPAHPHGQHNRYTVARQTAKRAQQAAEALAAGTQQGVHWLPSGSSLPCRAAWMGRLSAADQDSGW